MGIKQSINKLLKLPILRDGKNIGYAATIKELGNSVIMADTMEEIFGLIPGIIETCKSGDIEIFSKRQKKQLTN
jgi:hypothetical protein